MRFLLAVFFGFIATSHAENGATISKVPTSSMEVGLSFDDGPHPVNTPRLLDILKTYDVRATFFVIGENANRYPGILARTTGAGHEIGNHGWKHDRITSMSPAELAKDIGLTSKVVSDATGYLPGLFRPPYGLTTRALNKRISTDFQMQVVTWSIDPVDWKVRDSEAVAKAVLESVKPGDIILLHDIHATTVGAVPAILDGLFEKGLSAVPVSTLLEHRSRPAQEKGEPTGAVQSESVE